MAELTNTGSKTRKNGLISLALIIILVFIDQILKVFAASRLKSREAITLISGVLQLSYLENKGAAFGIFQGRRFLLVIIVGIVLLVLLYFILSGKIQNTFLLFTCSLIAAGGVGNLIDRAVQGYVIDYIDITPLFNFPVFNFADCCVVIGSVLLMGYILFNKEDVFKTPDNSRSSDSDE